MVQYRRDAQRGVLQVKVTNGGDRPVRVTHVRLDTPTFTAPVEADKDSLVGAGVSADLTVPLGEPACGPDGAARADGPHLVTLEVDGETVELPVGAEVLGPVAAERCAAAAVAVQVVLTVGGSWVDAGQVRGEPALRGTVVAAPRPGAPSLTVSVEGATTLFTVAEPAVADVPAGAPGPATLDVVLTVTRCDPHAVAEDKKGYLLPVRVAVDGAAPVLVEVAVPVPERAPLQQLVDRTCAP
ncbi:hypothetical protein [Aquipuribacter hungaricus]|uniref:hypothetical protein n=1 Tax=Aquipuribacter hungaricus TaxID=545624 RepID=UPI0036193D96